VILIGGFFRKPGNASLIKTKSAREHPVCVIKTAKMGCGAGRTGEKKYHQSPVNVDLHRLNLPPVHNKLRAKNEADPEVFYNPGMLLKSGKTANGKSRV
jgi:hypothetical protein